MTATLPQSRAQRDLTPFDRILLHLRCLHRDHKYRWHLAGIGASCDRGKWKENIIMTSQISACLTLYRGPIATLAPNAKTIDLTGRLVTPALHDPSQPCHPRRPEFQNRES